MKKKRKYLIIHCSATTKLLSDLIATYGRMRPLSGTEILANEKLGVITTHRFYCPIISVRPDDKIYDSNSDKFYEIKFIKNPMEMNDHLEVDCEYLEDYQVLDSISMDTSQIVSS